MKYKDITSKVSELEPLVSPHEICAEEVVHLCSSCAQHISSSRIRFWDCVNLEAAMQNESDIKLRLNFKLCVPLPYERFCVISGGKLLCRLVLSNY